VTPPGVLRAEAPAKINRELRVGGRRPDGYHELLSRFTSIALSDVLEVEPADTLELEVSGLPISGGGENLVVRAAKRLARELGIEPRARIRLEKRIPAGAGLGGGSSDAACALRLLAALWGADLAEDALARLALDLGSDVPYFLVGGEANVSGRGEVIVPLPEPRLGEAAAGAGAGASPVELLLLFPPFPISTRDAFDAYARQTAGRGTLPERLDIETSGNFFGPNELASAVLGMKSAMKGYFDTAAEASSERAMTGSGSTVVMRGAVPEAESLFAQRHPEATWTRTRTLARREYEYRARPSPPGGSPWTSPR
jgi:4-diphosphocytidyl-2C-methyl-D-erythritol kinase